MKTRSLLSALAVACSLVLASMSLAEQHSYECTLLIEEDSNVVETLKENAKKGGYVFAFRHADKNDRGALSELGEKAAKRARDHLSELWNPEDRNPTVFVRTHTKERIRQTRQLILEDVPFIRGNEEVSIRGLETWLQQEDRLERLFRDPEIRDHNAFVFVNSTAINQLRCPGGEKCACPQGEESDCEEYNFSCLEGVVIRLNDEGMIDMCYRFFPFEWAHLENAFVPVWAKSPPAHSQCAGKRP